MCTVDRKLARHNHTAANQEAEARADALKIPPLNQGSPAQINWANSIRMKMVDAAPLLRDSLTASERDYLKSAKWWIDNRTVMPDLILARIIEADGPIVTPEVANVDRG
jgi:hypothetical protein